MVGNHCFAKEFVVPVGVGAKSPVVEVGIGVTTAVTVNRSLHIGYIGIVVCFKKHLSVLLRICHLENVGSRLHTYISIIGNLGILVTFSFLSSDDYNTIGSTHTIDGSSRSVFEHRHLLNVAVVKEVDVVIEHAVNNIERRAVGERTVTADRHARTCTRSTTVNHVHTGNFTLDSRHWRS